MLHRQIIKYFLGVHVVEKNFEYVGIWWNSNDIEMYRIGTEVFALNGWNGDKYTECWKCSGIGNMDASVQRYEITPVYEEIEEDDYKLIGFEVREV